jgi:hypothetical protein
LLAWTATAVQDKEAAHISIVDLNGGDTNVMSLNGIRTLFAIMRLPVAS